MNQDQAINLLDRLISQQSLTREGHEQAQVALHLLRQVCEAFRKMNLEKMEAEKKAKEEEVKRAADANAGGTKTPIDNQDRSQA